MVNKTYLLSGLNALSRANELNYFLDGHRGGAIISGVYLCQDNLVEPGVTEAIVGLIDEQWSSTPLCAPFPEEPANPQLLGQIVACMQEHVAGVRQAGHNVILPSLALKAFHDVPEAITPARVVGVCRLIESFTQTDVPMAEDTRFPDITQKALTAEFVLYEFIACTERFLGRGQGWSGHLLTYGQALMDLLELGYLELVRQAEEGFRMYIRRIRFGPQQTDKNHREHPPIDAFPLQESYWRKREGDLRFGHKLKYPYGFYGLMRLAEDSELKKQCLQVGHRIF